MSKKSNKVNGTIIVLRAASKALIYCFIGFIFYLGLTRAYSFGYSVFDKEGVTAPPGIEKTIRISSGTSTLKAGELLEEAGLIKDKEVLFVQAKLYGLTIYPGEYTLNTSMSSKTILMTISQEPEEEL